jgi:hypothetical protein
MDELIPVGADDADDDAEDGEWKHTREAAKALA